MRNILVVDDDLELNSRIVGLLTDAGYRCDAASTGGEALRKAAAEEFDVILLDMVMPGGSGADVLPELRKATPRSRIIVVTAYATVKDSVDAMQRGASDYLAKPFKIEELLTKIRRALEEASFEKCGSKREFDNILSSLSNPIRTDIIHLLHVKKNVRLVEITKGLSIEDRSKVIFHLKKLKESGIIEQDGDRTYCLTSEGERARYCLRVLEHHLSTVM